MLPCVAISRPDGRVTLMQKHSDGSEQVIELDRETLRAISAQAARIESRTRLSAFTSSNEEVETFVPSVHDDLLEDLGPSEVFAVIRIKDALEAGELKNGSIHDDGSPVAAALVAAGVLLPGENGLTFTIPFRPRRMDSGKTRFSAIVRSSVDPMGSHSRKTTTFSSLGGEEYFAEGICCGRADFEEYAKSVMPGCEIVEFEEISGALKGMTVPTKKLAEHLGIGKAERKELRSSGFPASACGRTNIAELRAWATGPVAGSFPALAVKVLEFLA